MMACARALEASVRLQVGLTTVYLHFSNLDNGNEEKEGIKLIPSCFFLSHEYVGEGSSVNISVVNWYIINQTKILHI